MPTRCEMLRSDQVAVTPASSEASESSRGWAWHQPAVTTASSGSESGAGMVVYQLLTNGSAADGSTSTAGGGQQPVPVYYGVDAYGQLVPTTKSSVTASANESRLQQEVASLRTALEEKTREADTLRSQLVELCATIERYRSSGSAELPVKAEKSSSPANNVSDTPHGALAAVASADGE